MYGTNPLPPEPSPNQSRDFTEIPQALNVREPNVFRVRHFEGRCLLITTIISLTVTIALAFIAASFYNNQENGAGMFIVLCSVGFGVGSLACAFPLIRQACGIDQAQTNQERLIV